MKLLIDQNLPGEAATLLRELGHDAVSAAEIGLDRASDDVLIQFAKQDTRVIATLDGDYSQIISTRALSGPSVIFLRERTPNHVLASALIHEVCARYEPQLMAGCLITCTRKAVRVRALPIQRT